MPNPSLRISKARRTVAGMLAALALVALTLWMWSHALRDARHTAELRFEFQIEQTRVALEQRLLAYQQVLHGGTALFAAVPGITRAQWGRYVGELNLGESFPAIQSVAFAQRIRHDDLEAHVRATRTQEIPAYAVRPPGERSEYAPVLYSEPSNPRNQRALGLDLMSDPVSREALLRAGETALPAMSGRLQLAQESDLVVQDGFLMCTPAISAAPGPSKPPLDGFICLTLPVRDLMRGLFGPEELPAPIQLEIFAGTAVTPEALLYDNVDDRANLQRPPSVFVTQKAFEIQGAHWLLRLSSPPELDASIDVQKPRLILLGGLLLSALLPAVFWSLSMKRQSRAMGQANAALERDIAAMKRISRMKSEFISTVSHELRTPLTAIRGSLGLIAGGVAGTLPKAVVGLVDIAKSNCERLIRLVNDILDIEKIESGKIEFESSVLDLRTLVAETVVANEGFATQHGVSLSLETCDHPLRVEVDGDRVTQVLTNLISNAAKFSPAGGVVVVGMHRAANNVRVEVSDKGCGIPEEFRTRIFEKFSQADSSDNRAKGGTGLGLNISKAIIERLGGTMGFTSETGNGTTFFFELPEWCERLVALPAAEMA